MTESPEVFISYSREDASRVLELAGRLREAGVSLWIDQGGIDSASPWSEQIVNALDSAKVLLLMVSESAVHSHNVTKEVALVSERKGHILPVHLQRTLIPASLKYQLAGLQHVEYFDPAQADANLKAILRSLERIGVRLGVEAKPPVMSASAAATPGPAAVQAPAGGTVERGALAVMPFDNISTDSETDYFSDGLTEELIARLSAVSEIDLVSRWATKQMKERKLDLQAVSSELGARYIVGGSVRRFQDSVRITVQLVDTATNRQQWGNTYKGKLDDIFDIQEQVAQQIVEALKLKLTFSETRLSDQAPDRQCSGVRPVSARAGLSVSHDKAQRRVRHPAVREGNRAGPAVREPLMRPARAPMDRCTSTSAARISGATAHRS